MSRTFKLPYKYGKNLIKDTNLFLQTNMFRHSIEDEKAAAYYHRGGGDARIPIDQAYVANSNTRTAATLAAIPPPEMGEGERGSRKLTYCIKGCVIVLLAGIIACLILLPHVIKNLSGLNDDGDGDPNKARLPASASPSSPTDGSNTTLVRDSRLNRSFWGMDYTPLGTQLEQGCGVTQQDVIEDLKLLYQLTPRIRLYGMDCNQAELVMHGLDMLKIDMGVLLTLWVDGNTTTYERQYNSLWKLIKKHGGDRIIGISVGNEGKNVKKK